jgi:TolB-like protein
MPTDPPRAVFLSYAREDTESARRIADALRAFGLEVWFDQNELRGGDAWDARIRRQIRECALFIPIVSAHTQARGEGYFRREWKLAVDRTHDMSENRAYLVPVITDGTSEAEADVPEQFLKAQFTRLAGGVPTAEFVDNVKRLLQSPHTPGPRAATGASAPPIDAGAAPDPKSIAVLPFTNMSPDKEQEYFSDGIAEELMNLLAQVPELRVAARTSSFFFKGQHVELQEIARKLNVAHLLEGSVRKAGNRVRVTAQLIHAAAGYHLWSQTWDRTLDDIFAVQDEIAAAVVARMKVTLLGAAPKKKTYQPEAYALFLQGREIARHDTAEAYDQAIAFFRRAVETDSRLAPAWVETAKCRLLQVSNGILTNKEGGRLAREAVGEALAIDPDLAGAHASLGVLAERFDADPAAAARHFERALALDPANIDILGQTVLLARGLGRLELCARIGEYIALHDPVNPAGHARLSGSYFRLGRYDEAIASGRTALRLSPGRSQTHYTVGLALLRKGDPKAALAEICLEPAPSWRLDGLAIVHHALGDREKSDAALAELVAKWETDAAWNIAYVHAFRGETDQAYAWLDRAADNKDPGVGDTPWFWQFDSIKGDPRWLPFLRRIGKASEQLAAIPFDVKLPSH